MRLVFRDYLQSLRERRDLDRALTNLVVGMEMRPVAAPALGMPEHGVDIAAVGRVDTTTPAVVLIQVKQGDITRRVWGTGVNSVRASLDDAIDHREEFRRAAGRGAPRRVVVVVATNGVMDRNVIPTFQSYCSNALHRHGVTITEWNIDKLVDLFMKHLFREQLFPPEDAQLLRRMLAFVEIPEYDLSHFSRLLRATLNDTVVTEKIRRRKLLQIQVALGMLMQYASADANNLATSVRGAELALVETYGWLYRHDALSGDALHELERIVAVYLESSLAFVGKVEPLAQVPHGLLLSGFHEAVEYPLRSLKVAALAAQWLLYFRHAQGTPAEPVARALAEFLVRMRSNCSGIASPLFDYQMVEVGLIALALFVAGGHETMNGYLEEVVNRLRIRQMRGVALPEGSGDFELVAKLWIDGQRLDGYIDSSSTLLTMIGEIAAITGNNALYEAVRVTAGKAVNLQNCYLNARFLDWSTGGGRQRNDDVRVEPDVLLPDDTIQFTEAIATKAGIDDSFGELHKLPAFELIYHIVCRTKHVRLTPRTWRGLPRRTVTTKREPDENGVPR